MSSWKHGHRKLQLAWCIFCSKISPKTSLLCLIDRNFNTGLQLEGDAAVLLFPQILYHCCGFLRGTKITFLNLKSYLKKKASVVLDQKDMDRMQAQHMDQCTAAIIGVVSLTDINSQLSPGLSTRQTSISRQHAGGSITVWGAQDDVRHHPNDGSLQLSKACLLILLIACPLQINLTYSSCL